MRFMGIDPSLTSTGICYPDGETTTWSPKAATKGVERLAWFSSQLNGVLADPTTAPNLIVIEGYSFGSKYQAHQLGELGGVLRLTAHRAHRFVVEVPPPTLKKFATGKGNASKDEMLSAAVLASGRGMDNNEADAFWLMQCGLHIYFLGGPGGIGHHLKALLPPGRRAVIADLNWPNRDDAEVLGSVASKALRGDDYTSRAEGTGGVK